MRFLATFLYLILKLLVLISYRIFYSRITIINKKNLSFKNPAIVISNHPSTLMDPLNVASKIPRRVAFLANAGLFGNKLVARFLKVYCIPVERPKDVNGRRINNEDNFARAHEHLADNGCIYIAAEGTSVVERRLRNLKTGAARIALSAEAKKNFQLGVTILPVALNYSDPLKFRSSLLLNVGEPVSVNAYQTAHKENPFQASRKMTADLQEQMKSLLFHTEEEAADQLLTQVQTVLQSDYPLDPKAHFLRSQDNLDQIHNLDETAFEALKKNADAYFDILNNEDLKDLSVSRHLKKRSVFPDFLKLVFGLPLFLYGWINNFLAFFIPGLLAKKLKIYPGYIPAVKTLAGLIFLPLIFYLQTKLVIRYVDFPYAGWIYLLTLLPMGWLAWQYWKIALRFFQDRKLSRLKNSNPEKFEALLNNRKMFLNSLNPEN